MTVNRTAVLAFVPVLHKGYLDFFSGNEGDIWILGDDVIENYVHLTRDLRRIPAESAAKALQSLLIGRKTGVANERDITSFPYDKIVMPDDEVCRDIAVKFFSDREVSFVGVFLRWNKIITFKEHEIPAHRKISTEEFHREILAKASLEARKSNDWWRQIASIVVKDGNILFSTYNHHLPTDFHLSANGDPRSNFDAGEHQDIYTSIHSEAEAIAKAARDGVSLKGASLYATTFPCPNCARLIGTAGIKTLYYSKGYSLLDAEKILDHFGVEIVLVQ